MGAVARTTDSGAVAPRREITTADLPKLIADSKDARALIAPFLPEGVSLDRVAASLRLALAKDKDGNLKKCAPMSVFMAVAKIQQWGLEIGETAHLVPFGQECVPVADYKGLAELVISSGVARHVEAHCVYEKEPFRVVRGTSPEISSRDDRERDAARADGRRLRALPSARRRAGRRVHDRRRDRRDSASSTRSSGSAARCPNGTRGRPWCAAA
jgi:hypothetical protein